MQWDACQCGEVIRVHASMCFVRAWDTRWQLLRLRIGRAAQRQTIPRRCRHQMSGMDNKSSTTRGSRQGPPISSGHGRESAMRDAESGPASWNTRPLGGSSPMFHGPLGVPGSQRADANSDRSGSRWIGGVSKGAAKVKGGYSVGSVAIMTLGSDVAMAEGDKFRNGSRARERG